MSSQKTQPSSYTVSDSGDDRNYATSATRTEPSNHRFSPYTPLSIQITAPSFYSLSNRYSPGYALPHRRPHQDSRRRSYGPSSRSASRSLSPFPGLSPPTRPGMPPIVKSESYFATGTDLSLYPHAPSQLAQVTTASPSTATLPLPPHPALEMFRGHQAFLTQRMVKRLMQPYCNETESEVPFGRLPKQVFDRVQEGVDYQTLIFAKGVSRGWRRMVDPQRADRVDKMSFVRDRESRGRHCKAKRSAGGNGIQYKIGCYFCYIVKDAKLFEAPGNQKHYAVIWIDDATKKARYEGLADDDPRIPKPNDGGFKDGIKSIAGRRPRYNADTMGYEGGYAPPGQELTHSQVWQPPVMQPAQHGLYNNHHHHHHNGNRQSQHYHNHHMQQHPQQHDQQQPERAAVVSLRRYCIECGVENDLYEPRAVFKCWTEKRKLWVCDCARLPPIERIHDQEKEDFCSQCNVRASYR